MKMRMPAYPLVTMDPYFSIWSFADNLNDKQTVQWTGFETRFIGIAVVDGVEYVFMGEKPDTKKARQRKVVCTALSTEYAFVCGSVEVAVKFTSPVLVEDVKLASRPVSYIHVSTDSKAPVEIRLAVSEQMCLTNAGQHPVDIKTVDTKYPTVSMGSRVQNVLGNSGDSIHIDYGYFYLTVREGIVGSFTAEDMDFVYGSSAITKNNSALFAVAYDDICSIEYFGEHLKSVWNNDGTDILVAISDAVDEYDTLLERCNRFDEKLYADACKSGGAMYADMLMGAYRQIMAGHKAVVSKEGEILWISKECSSNGCAATVDITYPSAPMFLIYNTELVRGMLRPVFRYAESDAWEYDFAPHDEGTYPIVNGQTYYECKREYQMPVEECGNMLLITSAVTLVEKNADFALAHKKTLDVWAEYLMGCGFDPENQLCTDDFAGHLAHNCNLSLKAICALAAYARVCALMGDEELADKYSAAAKTMAAQWSSAALNADGTTRLAFDQEGTYSLKYNIIWDKLLNLGLFDEGIFKTECETYRQKAMRYGTPLDSRALYTKSDWLMWCAAMNDTPEAFEAAIKPMWDFYNETPDRVPMTDWYDTDTGAKRVFQHRTVQGGLWIKMLLDKKLF